MGIIDFGNAYVWMVESQVTARTEGLKLFIGTTGIFLNQLGTFERIASLRLVIKGLDNIEAKLSLNIRTAKTSFRWWWPQTVMPLSFITTG